MLSTDSVSTLYQVWEWGEIDKNKSELEQLERLCSEIPPAAPWLPILVIHIRSQVKTRQSQSYKFKTNAKNLKFEILHKMLNATRLLKLLDKMYKYEMDSTRTVDATEQTRNAGRTDGRLDRWTDRVKPIYPLTTSLCGGYKNTFYHYSALNHWHWH